MLRDCESAEEMTVTANPSLRRIYREEVDRFRDNVRSWSTRHNAGYSFITAGADFDDIVLRVLRRDGLVR